MSLKTKKIKDDQWVTRTLASRLTVTKQSVDILNEHLDREQDLEPHNTPKKKVQKKVKFAPSPSKTFLDTEEQYHSDNEASPSPNKSFEQLRDEFQADRQKFNEQIARYLNKNFDTDEPGQNIEADIEDNNSVTSNEHSEHDSDSEADIVNINNIINIDTDSDFEMSEISTTSFHGRHLEDPAQHVRNFNLWLATKRLPTVDAALQDAPLAAANHARELAKIAYFASLQRFDLVQYFNHSSSRRTGQHKYT